METKQLLKEINQLPVSKRIFLIEQALQSIRKNELSEQMTTAAENLLEDYKNDLELTAFTNIDFEDFYETR